MLEAVVVLVVVGTQTTFGSSSLKREVDAAGRMEPRVQGTMTALSSVRMEFLLAGLALALVVGPATVLRVVCLWFVIEVLNVLDVVLVAEVVVNVVVVAVVDVDVVVVVAVVVIVVVPVVLLVAVVLVDVTVLVVAVEVLVVLVFVLVENIAASSAADGITTHTKPDTTSGFGDCRGFSPSASLFSQHLSVSHWWRALPHVQALQPGAARHVARQICALLTSFTSFNCWLVVKSMPSFMLQ